MIYAAAAAARIKSEFNHELHIIPKNALQSEIGSEIYFGGMQDETSAGVNPARYVHGLANAAQRHMAPRLFDHTRVTRVSSQPSGANGSFRVETNRGALIAKKRSWLASGAYTTEADTFLAQESNSHRLLHHHYGSSSRTRSPPKSARAIA